MDAPGELYVQALFHRLEEIHDEMMGHVEPSQRQHILVISPLALYQADIQTLLLEEALLDRAENRGFARQADVTHADLHRFAGGGLRFFIASAQDQSA